MSDIVAFLRARLDEDEAWGRSPECPLQEDASRVLREVEAKRRLIAEFVPPPIPARTDAELHAAFAHPAYEYRLTEGQRKAWDYADEPPEGDGWERNTDAGRDGWERFDYHEESYWRRLRPGGPRPPHVPRVLRILALPHSDHPDYDPSWRP